MMIGVDSKGHSTCDSQLVFDSQDFSVEDLAFLATAVDPVGESAVNGSPDNTSTEAPVRFVVKASSFGSP